MKPIAAIAAISVLGALAAVFVYLHKQQPPVEAQLEAQREAAIRAGIEVIDRAIDTGRFTRENAVALGIATAELGGVDRAEVYARLSKAINDGRIRPDRDAMTF
jgi:diketogulonate reductase-like aldo/keto reductase